MNRKVFIIVKGSYSDYHICAVTMDKGRAEKLKRFFDDRYEAAEIEEYVLDEFNDNSSLYYVEFSEGESPRIKRDEYDGFGCLSGEPYVEEWWEPVRVCVRAKDAEHALKIAQDEYAKWKAQKEGIA